MAKIKFRWAYDNRLFVIIPTITIEDFSVEGNALHVVFRFGPFALTAMKDRTVEESEELFKQRMEEIEKDRPK